MPLGWALFLFCAYGVLLFVHSGPISLTDYGNWTYQGVLLQRHLLGLSDTAHRLKPYPVPNSVVTVAVGLLSVILPWNLAAKIWLCLQFGLSFLVTRHMMQTTGASRLIWWIAPLITCFNLNLWYGFVSFQLGVCWIILLASLLMRMERGEFLRESWIGLLMVVSFFSHMIPFVFCCVLLFMFARQTDRRRLLWQALPSALLSVWYVVGRYAVGNNADNVRMISSVRSYTPAFWAFKVNSYLKSFGLVNPIGSELGSAPLRLFGDRGFLVLLIVNGLLCGLVGWCMIRAARDCFRTRGGERFLWSAVLWVLPVFLLLPGAALGVSDPGARVLQSALAVAIFLKLRSDRVLGVAAIGAGLVGMTGLFLFGRLVCLPEFGASRPSHLPEGIRQINHVSYQDQDFYYTAIRSENWSLGVFASGIFLNTPGAINPLDYRVKSSLYPKRGQVKGPGVSPDLFVMHDLHNFLATHRFRRCARW